MSSPYDRYDRGSSRRRGVFSHWVPLVVTVTVATVGIAAWVWSQRNKDDEEEDAGPIQQDLDYENADYGDNPPYGASHADGREDDGHPRPPPSFANEPRPGEPGYGMTTGAALPGQNISGPEAASGGWGATMSGALRRTASPQQFLGSAGKTVAAGMAAAGAVVGSALASIREGDKTAYADHETWSEEADAKNSHRPAGASAGAPSTRDSGKRRKVVAVVVSADAHLDYVDDDTFHEHASMLSHIPRHTDFSKIKLYILIYAPGLKESALDASANLPPASLSSSFSNIGHDQVQTPKDETKSPLMSASSGNPAFHAVYSQAISLVEKESMVLPFTSANGYDYILRHLKPDVVYLQESLSGDNGAIVSQLQTWLRHDVILVVGAESGHGGGLADSESEAERESKPEKWWQREDRVGRGRGVVVVDGMRVHDDWARRVQGLD